MSSGRSTEEGNYKGYADPSHVIAVDEAAGLLGREGVVFMDTRNYWKYAQGHVPGAVDLELYAFHWFDTSRAGLETFAREMAHLFGACGIDEATQVVFYQEDSGYDAARGVWLLEFLGNKNGRILDGGFDLWKRTGRSVSVDDPVVKPARFTGKPDPRVVCGLEELRGGMGKRELEVLDVRSPGEYDGSNRRALKAGHIPGARNIEWRSALRGDGTLRDAGELRAIYSGVPPTSEVVTYCQSGFRASHSWLVLRLLGYGRARNYLGSWYEWGNDPSTPVER